MLFVEINFFQRKKTRHVTKVENSFENFIFFFLDLIMIMSDIVQDRYAVSQQMDSPWAYLYLYFFSVIFIFLYLSGLNMCDTVKDRYAISQQMD